MTSLLTACLLFMLPAIPQGAPDDPPPLADYFGFEPLEVIRIGRNAGPVLVADMNSNGLNDLVVVNNHASRIEVHFQKEHASPDSVTPPRRVNEFPEHWRYWRETVSVLHRVTSFVAHDFDGDGLKDIIYAGQPGEIVFIRQTAPGRFEVGRRHPVRNLGTSQTGLVVADVIGDQQPELLALVGGEIHIWPMTGDLLGQPTRLAAGANMLGFTVRDFNGDGRLDVAGIIPEDAAPIRIWFGASESGRTKLGPQTRFEMPAIRALEPVSLPGDSATRLAVIEQASRRLVVYEIADEQLPDSGNREAAYHVHSFTDPGNRKRDVVIADLDGDGLLDVIATDTQANALVVYRQIAGRGLQPGVAHATLSDVDAIAVSRGHSNGPAEVHVVSEKESVVGRASVRDNAIEFPVPLKISDGTTPVTMEVVDLDGSRRVVVVAKNNREHMLELLDAAGERKTIPLGSLSRSPETILAVDADQDGRTDLLLFTRDRPMTMLHARPDTDHGFALLESNNMGQFGLVQAARAENTALFDIDGNGRQELLIADRNFIRAVRFDSSPGAGVSPGWQVVKQLNAADSTSRLVAITVLPGNRPRLVAADSQNNRLVLFARDSVGEWRETESISITGFAFTAIHGGAFSGDGRENILAIGADGFAVIRLSGERHTMREVDAWRSPDERHLHHYLASGDINSDGFTDLLALDAGDQLCEIFTFSQRGRLMHATNFKMYESRIFTGGTAREFQPNQAIIADVTGNGANDLILVTHDRILIQDRKSVV